MLKLIATAFAHASQPAQPLTIQDLAEWSKSLNGTFENKDGSINISAIASLNAIIRCCILHIDIIKNSSPTRQITPSTKPDYDATLNIIKQTLHYLNGTIQETPIKQALLASEKAKDLHINLRKNIMLLRNQQRLGISDPSILDECMDWTDALSPTRHQSRHLSSLGTEQLPDVIPIRHLYEVLSDYLKTYKTQINSNVYRVQVSTKILEIKLRLLEKVLEGYQESVPSNQVNRILLFLESLYKEILENDKQKNAINSKGTKPGERQSQKITKISYLNDQLDYLSFLMVSIIENETHLIFTKPVKTEQAKQALEKFRTIHNLQALKAHQSNEPAPLEFEWINKNKTLQAIRMKAKQAFDKNNLSQDQLTKDFEQEVIARWEKSIQGLLVNKKTTCVLKYGSFERQRLRSRSDIELGVVYKSRPCTAKEKAKEILHLETAAHLLKLDFLTYGESEIPVTTMETQDGLQPIGGGFFLDESQTIFDHNTPSPSNNRVPIMVIESDKLHDFVTSVQQENVEAWYSITTSGLLWGSTTMFDEFATFRANTPAVTARLVELFNKNRQSIESAIKNFLRKLGKLEDGNRLDVSPKIFESVIYFSVHLLLFSNNIPVLSSNHGLTAGLKKIKDNDLAHVASSYVEQFFGASTLTASQLIASLEKADAFFYQLITRLHFEHGANCKEYALAINDLSRVRRACQKAILPILEYMGKFTSQLQKTLIKDAKIICASLNAEPDPEKQISQLAHVNFSSLTKEAEQEILGHLPKSAKSWRKLVLHGVRAKDKFFKRLLSKLTKLEKLVLIDCTGLNTLNMKSKQLQRIIIKGESAIETINLAACDSMPELSLSPVARASVKQVISPFNMHLTPHVVHSPFHVKMQVGHTKRVTALALLNGRFASTGSDNLIALWNQSFKRVGTLKGHASKILTLAFTPGGRLISAAADKSIKLWNTKTKTCLQTWFDPDTPTKILPLTKTSILTISANGQLKLRELAENTCRVVSPRDHSLTDIVAMEDKTLLTPTKGNAVLVWKPNEFSIDDLVYVNGTISCVADFGHQVFGVGTKDGRVYVFTRYPCVRIKRLRCSNSEVVSMEQYSNQHIAICLRNGHIHCMNTDTWKTEDILEDMGESFSCMSAQAQIKEGELPYLVTGNGDGVLKKWKPAPGLSVGAGHSTISPTPGLSVDSGHSAMSPTPGVSVGAGHSTMSPTLSMASDSAPTWTTSKHILVNSIPAGGMQTNYLKGVHSMPVVGAVRKRNAVVTASRDNSIIVWNKHMMQTYFCELPSQIEIQGQKQYTGSIQCLASHMRGSFLLGTTEGYVVQVRIMKLMLDTMTHRVQHVIKISSTPITQLAPLNHNQNSISFIYGNQKGEIGVIVFSRTSTDPEIRHFSIFRSHSKESASSEEAQALKQKRKDFLNMQRHKGPVTSIVYLEDVQKIVTGSADNKLKVWNEKGQCIHTFNQHTRSITALAKLKRGFMLSASEDGSVKLWDINTLRRVRDFQLGEKLTSLTTLGNHYALLGTSNGGQCILHLETGKVIWHSKKNVPHSNHGSTHNDIITQCLALDDDGKWISADHEGHIFKAQICETSCI